MRLFAEKLRGWANVADVFVSLFAEEPNSFWLDREHNAESPFSVIGSGSLNRFSSIQEFRTALLNFTKSTESVDMKSSELPFEFRPGFVGAFDYESENIHVIKCNRAIVFDHSRREMYFLGLFETEQAFKYYLHSAFLRLALVGGQLATYRHSQSRAFLETGHKPALKINSEDYVKKVNECKEFIRKGDVYQICLTNQVTFETNQDPLLKFVELRQANPAPYANYFKFANTHLIGSSPESFLQVDAVRRVFTRPIKGTRGRATDPIEDESVKSELQSNQKERAENLMIVDLMRNDLAQVCSPESIRVDKLFEVKSFSTVHQLVSEVSGSLVEGKTAVDAFEATFPAGSMTGAPKIRAMKLLADTEREKRGLYSGASGYFSLDGKTELAMTIRSLVFHEIPSGLTKSPDSDTGSEPRFKVTLGIGGGITIDSDATFELKETMLKAKALLGLFQMTDPWQ
jgi:anthranilate/para-aminobenzoate synthase component I